MLQCQNFVLGDQARNYQAVAEKAVIWCAQYKYKKRWGKVNKKKVHAMIASAPLDWDPGKWDWDIWDERIGGEGKISSSVRSLLHSATRGKAGASRVLV